MSASDATLLDHLKTYALYPLPQHLLSRAVYWLTRQESSLTPRAISRFARAFDVDMNDAVEPALSQYRTFNEFFTRALKPEARPITSGTDDIASPADGRISAVGAIDDARVFQAKGRDYSLLALLGGDGAATERLGNGRFATIYLSPRDYHRLHMPLSGRLIRQTYVPGRLFSVGPHTVRALPDLFTRNERVIAQFETEHGLLALVLVGAINVAAIETVWHGLVTPPQRAIISQIDYPLTAGGAPIELARGAEMGRFNMGSTIIVLLENPAAWRADLQPGDAVRMGQFIGQVR
jgi:phosphatidylserine decarboxylase